MNYEETLEYIHSTSSAFCKPGLERINTLLDAIGHPERDLKFIHVAGTNGKGSTSSMLSSILISAGYKVGLYTSPYVRRFNERMKICGKDISDERLVEIIEKIKPIADGMQDAPTEFELITAIAFQYFSEEGCDVIVLEVGLGGRLDSTNVIENPLLSVITGISLDHTAYLGDTIEKIAYEKAGIIKPMCPVIFGGESIEAEGVIRARASELGSDFYKTDYSLLTVRDSSLSGTVFSYRKRDDVKIKLLGLYQPKNASLVLDAVDILNLRGFKISEEAIIRGLAFATWPARFEIIHASPTVIFDGAHNAEGIEAAVNSISHYFGKKKVVVVSGVLRDKEYEKIAKKISEVASCVYTVTPESPRALSAGEYAKMFERLGLEATPSGDIDEAIRDGMSRANALDTALFSLGSLYTYGNVIEAIKKAYSA